MSCSPYGSHRLPHELARKPRPAPSSNAGRRAAIPMCTFYDIRVKRVLQSNVRRFLSRAVLKQT